MPGATCTLAATSASRLATSGSTQVRKLEIMVGSLHKGTTRPQWESKPSWRPCDAIAPGTTDSFHENSCPCRRMRNPPASAHKERIFRLDPGFPVVHGGDPTVRPS